jgi:GTP:adenosylcobinamide-phosphate guanylyltransferase
MNAIITAGGKPGEKDLLFSETHGDFKAMLDVAGKPMIQWVLDAFDQAVSVEKVVVVGLPSNRRLNSQKLIAWLEGGADMVENIRIGMRELLQVVPGNQKIIVASSDIPALTPKMVDWFADVINQNDRDFLYNVIEKHNMEQRFPGSHRTYLHLKDLDLCGGDINALSTRLLDDNSPLWLKLVEARKSPLQQAAILGFPLLVGMLLRRFSLEQAVERISQRLQIRGQAIVCPFAEMGMDVDKPFQLAILRQDFARNMAS